MERQGRLRNQKVNKMIVEEFYSQYYRSPQYKGFVACGGKLSRRMYYELLKSMGYPRSNHGDAKTYEMVINNEVVFTGGSCDVAEELGYTQLYISQLARTGRKTRKGYIIREKPFKGHL